MMREEYPERYDKAWLASLPDTDPDGGKKLNRFGVIAYERTRFMAGDKEYDFADVPDVLLLEGIGNDYIEWHGKLVQVKDTHPDLRTAVETTVDTPRVEKWSNAWWELRRRSKKVAQPS